MRNVFRHLPNSLQYSSYAPVWSSWTFSAWVQVQCLSLFEWMFCYNITRSIVNEDLRYATVCLRAQKLPNTHSLRKVCGQGPRSGRKKREKGKEKRARNITEKKIFNLYMCDGNDWIIYTFGAWCNSMSFFFFFPAPFRPRIAKIDATLARNRRDKCAKKLLILTSYTFSLSRNENHDWSVPLCDDSATRV